MRSPFKFLDAYTLQDRGVFFGRDREVETLYDLLFRTPILLVHGLSGTGKTSLIQCGLASRYEGPDWYPFFIRRQENINISLRSELQKALPKRPIGQDLPGFLQEVFETYYSPTYLIFDQFEELFILGTATERAQFIGDLRAILDAELPCKIILVMREEYLGRLYGFEQQIPYLFDFRLRVEPMNQARVQEVISQSLVAFNISLEAPAADRLREIIENVSGGKSGIELPYLQVYLDLLYQEDYQRTYSDKPRQDDLPPLEFTKEEIAAFGKIEDVLEKFLLQQEQELQELLSHRYPQLPAQTVRHVLDAFVTEEGTKQPVRFQRQEGAKEILPEERVRALLPTLHSTALSECLEQLEERRLLRFSDEVMELAHDKLAALIHEQRTEEQRSLTRARARLTFAHKENLLSGAFLNRKQLEELEPYLEKLEIAPEIRSFIEQNKRQLEAREAAEKERQQRELRLAQEKLQAEQKASRRQRIFLSLLSLALVIAVWQFWRAQDSNKIALENLETANEATKLARAAQKADSLKAIDLSNALDTVNLARQEALNNLELAQQREREAVVANTATQRALKELQRSSERIVKGLLQESRLLIHSLDYEQAFKKLESAADLGVLKDSTLLNLFEIAYFYEKTGQKDKALPIAKRAGKLLSNITLPKDWLSFFSKKYRTHFQFLERKYYPSMVLIPKGELKRSIDLKNENYRRRFGRPQLKSWQVGIDSFYLSQTETTLWQFNIFCIATDKDIANYAYTPAFGLSGSSPAVNIDWYTALEYANWQSAQKKLEQVYQINDPGTGSKSIEVQVNWEANGYRLPTEAEWEYAARGGPKQSSFPYSGSRNLEEVAWYQDNSSIAEVRQAHSVGKKKPNSIGLYDMSGNAEEWCWDWYADYELEDIDNPKGPAEKKYRSRVLRGGSWSSRADFCELDERSFSTPNRSSKNNGVRLSLAVKQ